MRAELGLTLSLTLAEILTSLRMQAAPVGSTAPHRPAQAAPVCSNPKP